MNVRSNVVRERATGFTNGTVTSITRRRRHFARRFSSSFTCEELRRSDFSLTVIFFYLISNSFDQFFPVTNSRSRRFIVSNSIQHFFLAVRLLGHYGTEINPCNYLSRARVHAGDPRGMPDVGKNLVFNVLELIQIHDALAFRIHCPSCASRRTRLDRCSGCCCAVGHDQRLVIVREAPAFVVVRKFPNVQEGAKVIDKPFFREPR